MGLEIREGNISGDIGSVARPGLVISKFLLNAGSADLNIDGSVTPVEFTQSPPSGKKWYIHTISIIIEDEAINFLKFGGITALTNGLDFKVKEGGLAETTLGNFKKNSDFYILANDIVLQSSTTDILAGHVRVLNNTGSTFELKDSNSEYIKAVVNDNLTAINRFNILVRGYEVDE